MSDVKICYYYLILQVIVALVVKIRIIKLILRLFLNILEGQLKRSNKLELINVEDLNQAPNIEF